MKIRLKPETLQRFYGPALSHCYMNDPISHPFRKKREKDGAPGCVRLCCRATEAQTFDVKGERTWNGSAGRFQLAPLGYRRPAVYCLGNKLSRSRRDIFRPAADFEGFPSHAGNQGPVAFFLLLVVRAHAGSHRLVRRPLQSALALCRGFCPVVIGPGPYRPGGESRSPDRVSHSSRQSESPFIFRAGSRSSACSSPGKIAVCPQGFSTSGLEPD